MRLHHDRATNLLRRALGAGAERTSLLSARWNIAASCTDPYWTVYTGRPEANIKLGEFADRNTHFEHTPGQRATVYVEIGTRCRRCDNCRSYRRWLWSFRMTEELRRGVRTWYGTLTLRPSEQYRVLAEARQYMRSRGVSWEHDLSEDERFAAHARFALKEVTKYIKRFRKEAYGPKGKAPFKWVCVTERHKSGLPHFHMLVHEVEMRPIPHRILAGQWHSGFEQWRLVKLDENPKLVAGYLCAYLQKDFSTRIRCSEKYGEQQISTVGDVFASFKDALGPNEILY